MQQGKRIHITQGEKVASADPDAVISTILGSCVSCCLWDPQAGVGGMNHMLLTVSTVQSGVCDAKTTSVQELFDPVLPIQQGRAGIKFIRERLVQSVVLCNFSYHVPLHPPCKFA